MTPPVAALYVQTGGTYYNLPGVDPWGLPERDAREYAGPHPVIAHPPCQRWGRYWSGGPSVRVRRRLGDDAGCFAAALWAVRTFGGVLEHPEASHAWRWFGLYLPPKPGQWVRADAYGWTCCVEQGHYGHLARKATWIYVVGLQHLPRLQWGPSRAAVRLDEGYHSADERRAARGTRPPTQRLTETERVATPPAFRDLLVGIARGCRRKQGADDE